MAKIVVSNKPIDVDGELITLEEFIERAETGVEVELLTIDVALLNKELYESIIEGVEDQSGIRFVTTDDKIPDYVKEKVDRVQIKKTFKETDEHDKDLTKENLIYQDEYQDNLDEEDIYKASMDAQLALKSEIIKHSEEINAKIKTDVENLINQNSYESEKTTYNNKRARTYLFGSSKGGTGKTFTCLISAYRYAKTHPNEKVAICDFDIIDGQIGVTIHKIKPSLYDFYKKWKFGDKDFLTMKNFGLKYNSFPSNVDFYLAPKDTVISENSFWEDVLANLITNYDAVYFDSGIDYMNYPPISTLYKIADKILLLSTTSIKSVSSITKQISRLKGEIPNNVFSKSDDIGKRLNLIITQAVKNDEMNDTIFGILQEKVNIIGTFGILTGQIQKAEYLEQWHIFDNIKHFNQTLDKINE